MATAVLLQSFQRVNLEPLSQTQDATFLEGEIVNPDLGVWE